MKGLRRVALPDTILGRTVALTFGMVLLLTALNLAIIFLRPPPRDLPLSAYEVARLLEGKPIAKNSGDVRDASPARRINPVDDTDRLVGSAIAYYLGVANRDVTFERLRPLPENLLHLGAQTAAEQRLYPAGAFNPVVFNEYVVKARLRNGRIRVLERTGQDPAWSWQLSVALRLVLAFLLLLPIVWWFARQLALPIRAFASASDRVGREPGVALVPVRGPAEIRLAAAAVNDMQERLHRYLGERTGVVGAIAHDLRTPLARLRFHLMDVPDAARRKAESEIAEMEAMIRATMDFVQHETRPRVSERIDLALLVEGVVDDLADLGRPVSLEHAKPAIVRGDTLLLKRLFGNLLGNAVTYGKKASVRVDVAGSEAVVVVTDQGPGMSPADLSRAFEPFYRAESSRSRQTGGIGLGLAIVRGAARAHGGDVTLENGAGGGLVARVTLPLA